MADRALSGLLLIVAAVFGAWLFFRKQQAGASSASALSAGSSGGSPPVLPPVTGETPLQRLLSFAKGEGLTVTSTTGGQHNTGSLHYQGRAIDVSARGLSFDRIKQVMQDAVAAGFNFRDERTHPVGQRVWGGPHLHIEEPYQHLSRVAP